jgi:hypothetical protein
VSRDLSLTGLRLAVNAQLPVKNRIELELFQPQANLDAFRQQQPIRLAGQVMWHRVEDTGPQYGIHFEGLGDMHKLGIKDCLAYFDKPIEYAH